MLSAKLTPQIGAMGTWGDHGMKTHARVVVIGGGVVGVGTLYHLAKKGWR